MEALTDPVEARRWCEAVGLDAFSVPYLIEHVTRCEQKAGLAPAAWRTEQAIFATTLWGLTPDEVTKVQEIMRRASPLPFGRALALSEARNSAWLRNLIARQSALA
jgi:hypothetical protein